MNLPVFGVGAGESFYTAKPLEINMCAYSMSHADVRAQQKTDKNMYVHTDGIQSRR